MSRGHFATEIHALRSQFGHERLEDMIPACSCCGLGIEAKQCPHCGQPAAIDGGGVLCCHHADDCPFYL